MITKHSMMEPMLEACPSFRATWESFLEEWAEDGDPPLYLALADLARHLIKMLQEGHVEPFARVFAVVERWHTEGDRFVAEAATVGLLESLQNLDLHQDGTQPEQFREHLLPVSERWWKALIAFWEDGRPMTDD